MKPKSFRIISAFVFLFGSFISQSQEWKTVWDKNWQTSKTNYFTDVVEEPDGGFAVFGAIVADNNSSTDLWLLRVSETGEAIWQKTFGTAENEIPVKMARQTDGSYLLAAILQSPESTKTLLVKVNGTGEELWTKSLQDKNFCLVEDVLAVENGNFILAGGKGDDLKNSKLWMVQINGEGEIAWEKIYAETLSGACKSVKKLPDSGFSLSAHVKQASQKDADVWVARLKPTGDVLWESRIKSPNLDVWPECICCSPDSCFMVVGWQGTCLNDINSDDPIFDYDLQISKLDCKGKVLWTKNFDREGSEGGNAVTIRPDGNFVVAGVKATSFLGKVGPWLMLVDPDGNMISEMLVPYHFNKDQAKKIINTSDGGIVVIGPGKLEESRQRIFGWMMKFASL